MDTDVVSSGITRHGRRASMTSRSTLHHHTAPTFHPYARRASAPYAETMDVFTGATSPTSLESINVGQVLAKTNTTPNTHSHVDSYDVLARKMSGSTTSPNSQDTLTESNGEPSFLATTSPTVRASKHIPDSLVPPSSKTNNIAELTLDNEKYLIHPDGRIEKVELEDIGQDVPWNAFLNGLDGMKDDAEGGDGSGTIAPSQVFGHGATTATDALGQYHYNGNIDYDIMALNLPPYSMPSTSTTPSIAASTAINPTSAHGGSLSWGRNTPINGHGASNVKRQRQRHISLDPAALAHYPFGDGARGAWTVANTPVTTTPQFAHHQLDPIAEALRELVAKNQPGFIHGVGDLSTANAMSSGWQQHRPASADSRKVLQGFADASSTKTTRKTSITGHRRVSSTSSALGNRPMLESHPSIKARANMNNSKQQEDIAQDAVIQTIEGHQVQHLRPILQEYITAQKHALQMGEPSNVPGELSIVIMTARVAQKSYGTEKRFLCPPPQVILHGKGWWTSRNYSWLNRQDGADAVMPPNVQVGIPNDSMFFAKATGSSSAEWWIPSQGGIILDSMISNSVDVTQDDKYIIRDTWNDVPNEGRLVARQLHIADSEEKRRWVHVFAKANLAKGIELGEFPSLPVKVISKPSKKRQSAKNSDRIYLLFVFLCSFNSHSLHSSRKYNIIIQSSSIANNQHKVSCRFYHGCGRWECSAVITYPSALALSRPISHQRFYAG